MRTREGLHTQNNRLYHIGMEHTHTDHTHYNCLTLFMIRCRCAAQRSRRIKVLSGCRLVDVHTVRAARARDASLVYGESKL